MRPSDALAAAFEAGRGRRTALLMPFLVCGYPDDERFVEIAEAVAVSGAEVLEVGIPFSDPIMDGPVIQQASAEVLARGGSTAAALALIARAAERASRPVVVMTYYNLVFRAGLDRFASACAGAGACGAIVPDLTVEESGPWREASRGAGIAPILIAAPTSPPARLAAIGGAAEGFVYAASTLGVTGVRDELSDRARALVAALRESTDVPVAVGIGVSTPEHAADVAEYADGVIIGSALVERIREAADPVAAAGDFVASLRERVDARSR